jgi:hypothetical protein
MVALELLLLSTERSRLMVAVAEGLVTTETMAVLAVLVAEGLVLLERLAQTFNLGKKIQAVAVAERVTSLVLGLLATAAPVLSLFDIPV